MHGCNKCARDSGFDRKLRSRVTTKIDVSALQANGTIPSNAQWAYVNIAAPIKPDDMLAVAASFDASLRFGAQTPFTDQAANHWAGGIWEVDTNHNALIAIGNAGNTATRAQIAFYYNSGQSKYVLEHSLAPDEQVWVDVGGLIRSQIPDLNGKTIPPSVMSEMSQHTIEKLIRGEAVKRSTREHALKAIDTHKSTMKA
jgi:hypothetical protein